MTKTKQDHTHKLRRHRYSSGTSIYFCALPDCSYKITPPLALGKRALCWRCGEPFILNEYAIRLAKPHCENCHMPKGGVSPTIIFQEAPGTTEVKQAVPFVGVGKQDSAADLRSRLNSILKKPVEVDEDI